MCGVILVGYILLDILNTKKVKKSILLLIIYILVALISIWLFGGFTNISKSDNFGFGFGAFSYNLNGLINSQGWSVFLKELPMLPEQYEGFSYLGLGVIFLIIIAFILTIVWFIKENNELKKYRNLGISLIAISIISIFIALSPKAYIGEYLLYELKLPSIITDIWEIFRSTGRFVWPVIHILTLLSVIIILKRLNWKYSLLVLSICTFIQIIDIGSTLSGIHQFYVQDFVINDENNLYENKYLKEVALKGEIELLILVSDDMYDSDKMLYSDWALNNNIKTNKLHFARTSFDDILLENTIRYLEEKDESQVFVFTTKAECSRNGLNCYELPNSNYLGYIKELEGVA